MTTIAKQLAGLARYGGRKECYATDLGQYERDDSVA
jgi:hypothetical protein